MTFQVPEKYRVRTGKMATDSADGNNGLFFIPLRKFGILRPNLVLRVVASDGGLPGECRWEHVSVSLPDRCPTWGEMCLVKGLFWSLDSVVVQYHPAESDYVNMHQYCLHLWRPVGVDLPCPPPIMVGPQNTQQQD